MAQITVDSDKHVQTTLLYCLQPPFTWVMTPYFGLLLRATRIMTWMGKKR